MKRLILFFALVLSGISLSFAQNLSTYDSKNSFSLAVELGTGKLFGNSNLSPYGAHYRGVYDNGFSGNIKAFWRPGKVWQVGVKYNFFTASENYEPEGVGRLVEDVSLNYIAPQVGVRQQVGKRVEIDYTIGAGYMKYKSEGFCEDQEWDKFNTGFWGANFDLGLSYRVCKNWFLGLNASLMGGSSSSLTQKEWIGREETLDLDKWNKIRVLRADLGLSIKVVL